MRLKQAARLHGEIASLYVMDLFSLGKRQGKKFYLVSLWAYLSHSSLCTVMPSNGGMPSVHRERELWGQAVIKSGRADSKCKNEERLLRSFISGSFITSSSPGAVHCGWPAIRLRISLLQHGNHTAGSMYNAVLVFVFFFCVGGHQHKDCVNKLVLILR